MSRGATETIKNIKKSILYMTHYSQSSHVGSSLSIVDILYVLYFKVLAIDPAFPEKVDRDLLILSKGHASAALYATLAERGFFSTKYLEEYYIDGGKLPGHLDKESIPGVEISTGSLGHGLSIAIGMGLGNRLNKIKNKIFVILGDGECNEGSIWEAVMLAPNLNLNNLTAIVDVNRLQGFGRNNEIINQANIKEQWAAFGWEVYEVDGHNIDELEKVLQLSTKGPKVVLARTIKGKGISFMEDKLEWHYKSPNKEQYEKAIIELMQLDDVNDRNN